MGIAPRAEIAHPEQAKAYLDMGVNHFCIGWDVSILFDWFKHNGKAMCDLLGRSPAAEDNTKSAAGYGKQKP
jgi:4-hydroxy-2-oxoheptanedioate aldolase